MGRHTASVCCAALLPVWAMRPPQLHTQLPPAFPVPPARRQPGRQMPLLALPLLRCCRAHSRTHVLGASGAACCLMVPRACLPAAPTSCAKKCRMCARCPVTLAGCLLRSTIQLCCRTALLPAQPLQTPCNTANQLAEHASPPRAPASHRRRWRAGKSSTSSSVDMSSSCSRSTPLQQQGGGAGLAQGHAQGAAGCSPAGRGAPGGCHPLRDACAAAGAGGQPPCERQAATMPIAPGAGPAAPRAPSRCGQPHR